MREDKMEENSWLDIAMRDKEDRESDKQIGKRHAAISMLPSACYDPCCPCNSFVLNLPEQNWTNHSLPHFHYHYHFHIHAGKDLPKTIASISKSSAWLHHFGPCSKHVQIGHTLYRILDIDFLLEP